MEWLESIKKSVEYMEAHLLEQIGSEDMADQVGMSQYYLQKGFHVMTGYTMAEYIKKRRLYLAALDVLADSEKVIDIAYKYGYDTPESFTKAFARFHGLSPAQLRKQPSRVQVFLPLTISIHIKGGNKMDYVVEKMSGFKVIGFCREFSMEDSYQTIPQFWDEVCQNYMQPLWKKDKPDNEVEETICNCGIGEFGVCVDDIGKDGVFRYIIGGKYTEGDVPEGMTVYEIPDLEWAKFSCTGPMPGALQAVNTKVFNEWLPGNTEYEIAMGANVEWYSGEGKPSDADYQSGIWIPVKRK